MPDQTLAGAIRAKYPGAYDNVPDDQLETKWVAKYPEYKDRMTVKAPVAPVQPPKPAESSALWRFLEPQLQNFNPTNIISPLTHMFTPGGTIDTMGDQMSQLRQQSEQEGGMTGFMHQLAGYLPWGPAAVGVGNQARSGDIAGALGNTAGFGEGMFMDKPVGKALGAVASVGGKLPELLMNTALKAPMKMKEEFPGMAQAYIREGVLPTPASTQNFLNKTEGMKQTAMRQYDGTHIDNISPINAVQPRANDYVMNKGGLSDLQVNRNQSLNELTNLNDTYIDENPDPISTLQANRSKVAEGNRASFNPTTKPSPVENLFREGVALGNRDEIADRIPEYQTLLDRQQPFVGGKQATLRREMMPEELHKLATLGTLAVDPAAGARMFGLDLLYRNPTALGLGALTSQGTADLLNGQMGTALQKAILLGNTFNISKNQTGF